MLLAPHYNDLDLPIYDAEDVSLADVRNIDGSEDTVLRPVATEFGHQTAPPDSLKDLLSITDSELDTAAELCRANVIGHQWGLVHDPDGIHYTGNEQFALAGNVSGLVPKDHFLVAEIDVIKDVIEMRAHNAPRILAKHAMKACAVGVGLQLYRLAPHMKGYRLWDIMPSQFVIGSFQDDESSDDSGMWLVDIEPRLTSK